MTKHIIFSFAEMRLLIRVCYVHVRSCSFKGTHKHGQGVGVLEGAWVYRGAWRKGVRWGKGSCSYAFFVGG